ncbi:MAG: HAMP domain-containing histidine kinase [Thermoanaerobaculia bacterium]|nr:HAMP domain-containing histidine kinase [Thermoanaerobaculia bacterium]
MFRSRPRRLRPLLLASQIALLYALAGVAYILISTPRAAAQAASVSQLEGAELAKGVVFMLVSGAGLFAVCATLLHRVEAERRRLADLETALAEATAHRLPALFAASIAHDLNNVLHVLSLQAELLADGGESSVAASLQPSLRALADLNRRLAELGRLQPASARERFALDALLDDVVALAGAHASLRAARLAARLAAATELDGDRMLLGRAVLNLLINAGQAAPAGRVELRSARRDGEVAVEVHDDGPGVAEALRTRILEPYFTTKGSGSGLGLFSVRAAATAFGGKLEIERSELGGACFRLRLPLPRDGA